MANCDFFLKTWRVTNTRGGTDVKKGERITIQMDGDTHKFAPSGRFGDGNWPDVQLNCEDGQLVGIAGDNGNRVTIRRTGKQSIRCRVVLPLDHAEQVGEWDAEDDGGS